jgi:glycosyltransferase involved in cell wall biosynthesis
MKEHDGSAVDSVLYFCKEVWPLLRRRTGASLVIAGAGADALQSTLEPFGARVMGIPQDVGHLYEAARVVIAPTRYSAGPAPELYQAAAHGVPLVVSSMTGRQLGWRNETECLTADDTYTFAEHCYRLFTDKEEWERIRSNAYARVRQDFSEHTFGHSINVVIASVIANQEKDAR